MLDMTKTTEAKSDQLNAVDLTGAPKTITITKVSLVDGDQPCIINYEGDNGKPYKPCKGMRRGLVAIWGKDAEQYIGRKLTLIINPAVTWAGQAVGGIQITHASHINKPVKFPLTLSKQKRVVYTIEPLKDDSTPEVKKTTKNKTKPAELTRKTLPAYLKKVMDGIDSVKDPMRIRDAISRMWSVMNDEERNEVGFLSGHEENFIAVASDFAEEENLTELKAMVEQIDQTIK